MNYFARNQLKYMNTWRECMKKLHMQWLNDFLSNCQKANKSERTIANYRCDLLKYISWYEKNHRGQLNTANAKTISQYHSYISNQELNSEQLPTKKSLLKNFYSFLSKLKLSKKLGKNLSKKLGKASTQSHNLPSSSPDSLLSDSSPAYSSSLSTSSSSSLPTASSVLTSSSKTASSASLPLQLAVASRRRHLSAIKNFYEFLRQSNEDSNNLFGPNPVKTKLHSIRLKDEDMVPTKLLTAEDWAALTNSTYRIREVLMINLLYYGGLRLNELTQLKVDSFDRSKLLVRFARKGGDIHTLYIQKGKLIFSLLDKYLSQRKHPQAPYLFTNPRGDALTSRAVYNIIMKIIIKAGCPSNGITPHSFRKACATNLYRKSKDLLYVRNYLNHADAKVTQTYIEY